MARANVYNNEKKSNKGLIITIITTISLIVIAGVTCLTLWLLGFFSSEDEYVDAFADEKYAKYKITYTDLENKLANSVNQNEHILVFVYDAKTFNEEDTSNFNDIKNSADDLIEAVNVKNENYPDLFSFYMIDTSIEGNNVILQDSTYGFSTNTEEDKTLEGANPNLFYYYKCEWHREAPDALKDDLPKNKEYELGGLKYNERNNIARVLKSTKLYVNDLMNI